MFSAAEHARAGEMGETNQILSSPHQRPQRRTPIRRKTVFTVKMKSKYAVNQEHGNISIKDNYIICMPI